MCVNDSQMHRCCRCAYLVDGGSEEQCGWRSCQSDRTEKENRHTSYLMMSIAKDKVLYTSQDDKKIKTNGQNYNLKYVNGMFTNIYQSN